MLEVRSLSKSFKGQLAVDRLDLVVSPGEVVGLLGPNGAGKTTTFKMILGLLEQDEGEVFFGESLNGMPLHERARRGMGYLPQGVSVFQGLSVEDNLLVLFEALKISKKKRLTDGLLAQFGLTELRKRKARTLSGGEKRRLEFARTLCSSPTILLCDEPFAGVDPIAGHEIVKAVEDLSRRGMGVLLTDHSVREALGACDRVYLIVAGKIATCGTPSEIVNSDIARHLYFGNDFS